MSYGSMWVSIRPALRMSASSLRPLHPQDSKARKLPPFTDLVFLDVRDATLSLPTDPILLKSDQFPTYHLANVVDDHEMGVTHVLRGEVHCSHTGV